MCVCCLALGGERIVLQEFCGKCNAGSLVKEQAGGLSPGKEVNL